MGGLPSAPRVITARGLDTLLHVIMYTSTKSVKIYPGLLVEAAQRGVGAAGT